MPTCTSGTSGDVEAATHAGEGYATGGLVRGGSRGGERAAERGHVEDAAPVRHEPPVVERRARVEDERAGRLRVLHALDRRAGVAALGVVAGGEDDGDRGARGGRQIDA